MNDSERDLIPSEILSKSVEKLKSYFIFWRSDFFNAFLKVFAQLTLQILPPPPIFFVRPSGEVRRTHGLLPFFSSLSYANYIK